MLALELSCLAIVLLYLAVRLWRRPAGGSRAFFLRFLWLSCTSALGEDGLIRLYGFYDYAPGWSLFVDRVPLLVVLIWPIVIDSAMALAAGLCRFVGQPPHGRPLWLLTGAVVFVDAWLIEPIATQCGLWRWHAPGLFAVPPIGVLGWAYFAALSTAAQPALQPTGSLLRTLWRALLATLAVLVATHALLIVSWWGLLRWLSTPLAPQLGIGLAWATLSPLSLLFLFRRAGRHIERADLWVRVPAAGFFFVLLAVRRPALPTQLAPLLLYAAAFALPYWVLVFARSKPATPPSR